MKKRRPVLADQGRRFLTNSVGVDWLISISRKIFFTIIIFRPSSVCRQTSELLLPLGTGTGTLTIRGLLQQP